jgi:hypothetical protein
MPMATATSAPGTSGSQRLRPRTTARQTRPIARLAAFVAGSSPRKCHSCWKKFPEPFSTPNSFGSCPTRMVRASPMMKPLSTGSEMKLATKPSRRAPATMPSTPVTTASAAVSAMYWSVPAWA